LKVAGVFILIAIVFFSILLLLLNPNRGSFNHAVFEGGYNNSITADKGIMNSIIETNRKDYNNDSHPFIKRRNYGLYSIYDISVSDTKVYHVLGILAVFRLIPGTA